MRVVSFFVLRQEEKKKKKKTTGKRKGRGEKDDQLFNLTKS